MNEQRTSSKHRPLNGWLDSSLAKATLLKMGARIAIVIAVAAMISYYHIFSILNEQVDDSLQNYIVERGQKESTVFLNAERNHEAFKQTFVEVWPGRQTINDELRFNSLFEHQEDGTWRLRSVTFEGITRADGTFSRHITGYVGSNAPQTHRFQNKLLLSYDLIDRYADAWAMDYANLYVSMPENVNLVYWPGVPWGMQADSDLDVTVEEWVTVANLSNNPQRVPAWTGLYFDQTADEWMVSLETPVDYQGEHLITAGTDILLNTLFDQVFNDHLEGAYNFIFRKDGRIIAHPDQVNLLREKKGLLHVSETGDGELSHLIARITDELAANGQQDFILNDTVVGAKLAVTRIRGPEWVFVTVYPHRLMAAAALKTVYIVAIIGLLSLLIELVFLFRVLREQVLDPVKTFDEFARQFTVHEFRSIDVLASSPVSERRDEMGALALATIGMARSIEKYETQLKNIVAQRTEELIEANRILRQESTGRQQITSLLQTIAKDVSGLQGGEFFHRLSDFLSTELGADMVLLGRLADNGQTIKSLSLMVDNKMVDSFSYSLPGTPCEAVIKDGTQVFNGNVQALFPDDQDLFDLGMISYIGTRMLNGSGEVVGHLAVLKRSVFEQPETARLIIDSVSARAAYEFDRQLTERVILRQATTDSLTNLPNRAAFMGRLQQSLHQAERNGESLAVMFIDVDNFKLVNDQQGHAAGDLVLKTIASRLVKCVRKNDVLGRLGGDEFIVVLNDISSVDAAEKVARNILKEITNDMSIQGQLQTMSCSVGIAVYPQDATASDTLIRNADEAMYRAKDLGRNNYQFFRREMNEDIERNNLLEHDLRKAIANSELEVYYQPIMLLSDKCVYKLEALVRWNHPDKGLIMPDQFIPIAERSGLIVPLGDFVLEQACQDYSRLKQHFNRLESISVNFSARQFRDDGLIERVMSIVETAKINPSNIEIEITESLFIEDHDHVTINALHELSGLGFKLALDDFGTGYSSLGYLKKVPIDTLKIDQSFVRDLTSDPDDMSLVCSIIELAHSFRLAVIAEGVETQAQEEILRNEGCDFAQGYYYARPAPIDKLLAMLELDSAV
ncbi:MAG: EAL domain-containing protein [Pseudomonadales bacterium]